MKSDLVYLFSDQIFTWFIIYCFNETFNLSQSSICFVHTSLILSLKAKIKYLFPCFSSMYPSTLLITIYKGFKLWKNMTNNNMYIVQELHKFT